MAFPFLKGCSKEGGVWGGRPNNKQIRVYSLALHRKMFADSWPRQVTHKRKQAKFKN